MSTDEPFVKRAPVHFGDPARFAIRYVPGYRYSDYPQPCAWLHLVIGGQVIGDTAETCLTGTWLGQAEILRTKVEQRATLLAHEEFNDRSAEDVFELVWRANGQQSPGAEHLPQLPGPVWANCHISFDETTDAWLIALVFVNGRTTFMWQGTREPCAPELIGELFTHTVDPDEVIAVIEECARTVSAEAPAYPALDMFPD